MEALFLVKFRLRPSVRPSAQQRSVSRSVSVAARLVGRAVCQSTTIFSIVFLDMTHEIELRVKRERFSEAEQK